MKQETTQMIEALVHNYAFDRASYEKLPTINFVYPDYTADGNTEAFRFSEELERELNDRANVVREGLDGKTLAWTSDEETMLEVDKIAPRFGLDELISGKINSIYSRYRPFLYVGQDDEEFVAYVVKPLVTAEMAWFELTPEETRALHELLTAKAEERPHRGIIQKLFGRKI